ncbi:MAG: chemotaxis protein CheW [Acidobacteriota bacterium]|nr:chemotaxis protein CheW [Acidobacteriota bacterium]
MLNETSGMKTVELIRCETGGALYCLDARVVQGIQRTDHLRPNEANADATEPFGWVRDEQSDKQGEQQEDMPVFSLARRLGLAEQATSLSQRVITLNSEGGRWGLLVERVLQVVRVPVNKVEPLPAVTGNGARSFFTSVVQLDESMMLLLAPQGLHPTANLIEPVAFIDDVDDTHVVRDAETRAAHPLRQTDEATASRTQSANRILIFTLADEVPGERRVAFGLSVSQVLEILTPPPLTPVPEAPAYVRGLVHWRDTTVPVLDLAARFEMPTSDLSDESRLVICRSGETTALVGFLINPAVRSLQLPVAHQPCLRALPLNCSLAKCIIELENETLVIPDLHRMLES